MSKDGIEAIWYARLPQEWADAPEWMSYSRLREMEACPRRWSLSSASYTEIWSRRGYPSKIYFSALAGQIIHAALEMITNALNRAGCVSVTDDRFVGVMRELGGYTKIVEATVESTCDDLQDNPRFTSKSDYISKKLRNSVPMLREQVQILTGKLRLQGGFVTTTVSGSQSNRRGTRSALGNGTYSEVELRVDQLRWRGFIDALILSDTSCEIVDYKTGVPKPEHKEQVRFYSLLWARDAQLNPTGRTVNRLTLSYSTTDVAVEPLTRSQLNVLEQDAVSRSNIALDVIRQIPPPAVPSIHNCSYCSVRQLCGDYWTGKVQQLLAQEASRESSIARGCLIDLEVDNLEQQTPQSWNAVVLLCRDLPTRSQIQIRLSDFNSLLKAVLNSGKRVRIIDASSITQSEDDVAITMISLTKMSEAFIV